jgi:biopolymer transport protein ExbD
MRFYIRKRRQPPAIIIVALIDILIVLLIFLMVTTTFKQQPALKLALPESTQAKRSGAGEQTLLIISIDTKGDYRLGANTTPFGEDQLKSQLLAAVAKQSNLNLAISADKQAPIGKVVKVMDAAKEAKIQRVDLNTREAK